MRDWLVELSDEFDNPVVIVTSQITHLTIAGKTKTNVHLTGGKFVSVLDSLPAVVRKIWPSIDD